MTEEARLYYDSSAGEADSRRLGEVLKEAGVAYRAVDVSALSPNELEDVYARMAVTPSVRKGYRIRHIFGTNKYPGSRFGREEPALVVLEDGRPQDVYPHEEGGKTVMITDYIKRLRSTRRGRASLAARMDALRATIGRVGATSSELVDEGRRR